MGDPVVFSGRSLHAGTATGPALVLDEPVSWWGGVDLDGTVVDVHHPQRGMSLTGRLVLLRSGRGSSSAASVLAEQVRTGAAPAGIVLAEPEEVLVVGALVAAELYRRALPIGVLAESDHERLAERCRRATPTLDVTADAATLTVKVQP